MKPTRRNVTAFAEKAEQGTGMFLNAKDFTTARKIRPIAWLYKGEIIDIKLFLEGWREVKGKPNGMPVRFEQDEEIPEGQFKWKMSAYQGQSPTPQVPDVAIAFLCYDYKTQSIKLAGFTQKTIIRNINSFITEEVNGEKNELYIEDLTQVDIIIAKSGEKSYTVQTKESKTPKEIETLLDGFRFSWEAFMECGECFGEGVEISYDDVKEAMSEQDEKPTTTKQKPKQKVEEQEEDDDIEWEKVKSPKGISLGKLSDEALIALGEKIIGADNPDKESELYRALVKGLKERELELDDIPF